MNDNDSDKALSLLDGLICAYLTLPLLIFCAWFKLPVAIGLAALTMFGAWTIFRRARFGPFEVAPEPFLAICLVALVWTALAGVGHFFYANADWVVRDATMRDLVATPWPPSYATRDGLDVILRAPVGYYLAPALVGAATDLARGDLALYAWTALGFILFLCGATTLFATARQRAICGVVLIAFGGLDLVGFRLAAGAWPAAGRHIEWWAGFAQYSSNSTLLFWVPNHALPAWLGTVVILRHWKKPTLASLAPLFAATIPLWSPLAAIGLAPFFIAGIDWRRDARRLFSIRAALPLWAVALLVARFITMDGQSIPGGWAIDLFPSLRAFLAVYVPFCLFEFGLIALVLVALKAFDRRLAVAVAMLVVLPFIRFGPGNDLVMRASIPALAVLALATVRPLADAGLSPWRFVLAALLLVGAAGAAEEPIRAVLAPRWDLTGQTLVQAVRSQAGESDSGLPPHYTARLNQPGLRALLRTPTLVQPYPAAAPDAPTAAPAPASAPSAPALAPSS